ncbi:DegT/DnrJ/EryC1/StrS family aminotransferase [Flavobacterium myungsuense]|uniref:DegT/DnrJ/EryC1/StrS family aminotransferase n=1 Tax=Flavobacterium myungsuense TaxID=651823 RepID=A0ABW3IZG0_9FLAO
MINVTRAFLPPLDEYNDFLERIWSNVWLTNRGELVLELEEKLREFLKVEHILVTNNGTIPIQIALKLLANNGEVITTPFSYVATTASIIWENCTPVFVDIHPEYLTIDENKIEDAITDKTSAILATHVFGNPCNVEKIESIAKKYNLKVIYDAAHSFGVEYKNQSIFDFGDISTCSFHATKLFHTGEGGALFAKNKELQHQLFYSHNFGHNGPLEFYGLGINAKISELQAAMGLSVFKYLDEIISNRKVIVETYNENLNFNILKTIKIRENTKWNYAYYPILFKNEKLLLSCQQVLLDNKIMPRRYFYPSLNKINYVNCAIMPISEDIASRILCLPLYNELDIKDVERIINIINNCL